MNIRKFRMFFIIMLSLIAATGCRKETLSNDGNLAMTPVDVQVRMLKADNNADSNLGYSSTVGASKSVDLSFQVSGTILRIPVDVGEYVRKGQLLAEVDETIYRNQYQAQLAQAELAKENYERILTVYNKGSISEMKMLEAKASYEQTTSVAKATYQNILHTKLYAPQSGYIGTKRIEAGATAGPGIPIIELLDISAVNILVPIPESEINRYKKGDIAKIVVSALGDQLFEGIVDKVSVISSAGNPLYTVSVRANNPELLLKPGMSCKVYFDKARIVTDTDSLTFIVPDQAIQVDENGHHFVFVAEGDKAQRRIVQISNAYDNGVGILSGLKENDLLITSGFHKVVDGSAIKIVHQE